MKIAAQGFGYIGGLLVLAALCALFPVARPLSFVFFGAAAFVCFFFRDPHRVPPDDPKAIVSPGDGKVVFVGADDADSSPGSKRVTIFLSIFDVHINRSPLAGVVESIRYRPGRFLPAYRDEAGRQNEQNELQIADGTFRVVVRQIAGVVARRIVCDVKENERLALGQRFGLIQFGSRMDIVLPDETELAVNAGERVRGGETVIARRP
jgi:phosphatidylserine decarboxylase